MRIGKLHPSEIALQLLNVGFLESTPEQGLHYCSAGVPSITRRVTPALCLAWECFVFGNLLARGPAIGSGAVWSKILRGERPSAFRGGVLGLGFSPRHWAWAGKKGPEVRKSSGCFAFPGFPTETAFRGIWASCGGALSLCCKLENELGRKCRFKNFSCRVE